MSYQDRQQSLKLLQAGYAENKIPEKIDEIKRAQAMQSIELNEVEQRHPYMMISAGYRALDELNKPQLAETETTIQFGEQTEKSEEVKELDDYLLTIDAIMAQMDEILKAMNKTK